MNLALHDIYITFRSPYEVLNQCINYRYMEITNDKHVKFMFSKMQKWEQAADFELYITLEPRAEVSIEEEIVQTTTSLGHLFGNFGCERPQFNLILVFAGRNCGNGEKPGRCPL